MMKKLKMILYISKITITLLDVDSIYIAKRDNITTTDLPKAYEKVDGQ